MYLVYCKSNTTHQIVVADVNSLKFTTDLLESGGHKFCVSQGNTLMTPDRYGFGQYKFWKKSLLEFFEE